MMIQCKNIQKYHGAQLVLSDVSFEIREGEKAALIGRNGCGKTTMLHLLNGGDKPDQGEISISRGAKLGFLAQIPQAGDGETVYDILLRAFTAPLEWQRRMRELEALMSGSSASGGKEPEQWLAEYGRLQERFEAAGGYEMEATIDRIAGGLGIPAGQYTRPFASLSGGEKTKIGLASLLLEQPDVLLLDEPTNHLDMAAIEWLEQFLKEYRGTVLTISHDRYFLDKLVTKVVEIEDGEAFTYHTDYSGYQKEKEARLLQQFADYQEQQKKIKKMQESIKQLIEWGNRSNPPNAGFHRRAASMQKALDRMVKLKRPVLERKTMDLSLQQEDRSGKQVLVFEELGKSYGTRTLFKGVNETLRYGETVMLLGGNGSGKSTLIKLALGELEPTEGSVAVGSRVSIGYLAQEETPESVKQNVLQYYREQAGIEEGEARGRLARFLFYGADVFKDIRSLSGGEWTRLRFAILMEQKPNLLILDEPTNHLDIDAREALEEALEEFPGTIFGVSHDRYFINRLAARIWSLDHGQVRSFIGNFEDYQQEIRKLSEAETAAQAWKAEAAGSKGAEAGSQGKEPVSKPAAARPDTGERRSRKSDASASISLEQSIKELEGRLGQIDADMLEESAASDLGRLQQLHAEREQLQAQLEAAYEQWLELQDA
ncbi:ribosomal protection-like ABC-F family protein [Paenibacillus cellulositrophicus]|uniref:ribosomal protection-like ABC-F family protein n=1 Tax=Paenibacillus cellulositrophicus TaxID=562959 RepID=UPI003D981847